MANPAFTSPVGRLVQGDAFKANTTDKMGNALTIKSGPNAGQPTQNWFIAVAFPKNDPTTLAYLVKFAEHAKAFWPNFFANFDPRTPPLFGCSHPRFSMKIVDGDGIDDDGKPNSSKPGFAGHWVVKYSTNLQAPEVYHAGKYDPMERVTDARELPNGYYVRVFAGDDTNKNDAKPGMYVNLSKIEIVRPGEIIVKGVSAADAFGGGGAATPPASGASTPPTPPAAPVGGAEAMALVATGKDGQTIAGLRAAGWSDDQMVAGGYATRPTTPPAAPQPPAPPSPPTPPAPPAAPYSGYMQPPAAPDPDGPPAGFKMLPAAQGATYKSMIDAGWTQETLAQFGMVGPQ